MDSVSLFSGQSVKMDGGEAIIRWTARVAVAAYLGRLLVDRAGGTSRTARWIWTGGALVFLSHVVAAFHLQHHWDHAAAWEHTRKQTLAMTGWDSGMGLFLNELMTAWWLLDTVLWWQSPDWPTHRWPQRALHAFFAFMTFNATVIFGPPGWWVVLVVFIAAWLILPPIKPALKTSA